MRRGHPSFGIFFKEFVHQLALHSFPTRRSSDLNHQWLSLKLRAAAYKVSRGNNLFDKSRCWAASGQDRKSTRLNSSHVETSYAVFCLKKKTPLDGMTIGFSSDAAWLHAARAIAS